MAHVQKKRLRQALVEAEREVDRVCASMEVGSACRTQCRAGALVVIGKFSEAMEGRGAVMQGKLAQLPGGKGLGIIVSPFEDCPKGFERLSVKGGRNRRVQLCRLGPEVRKKYAPPGKPAYKGPLRRKTRPPYRAGVTARDIERSD
jgi:hypothetical protein